VFHEPFRVSRTLWDHELLIPRAPSGPHGTQTHTKRNKKQKNFKKFFVSLCFLFVFVFHEPFRVSRTLWDYEPLIPRAPSGPHGTQTHTKRNKKQKKL